LASNCASDLTAQVSDSNVCLPHLFMSLLQSSSSGDGTPSHADSSCVVVAAGESPPGAADTAGGELSASTVGPLLKPPVSSSSPDMAIAKGPLTASRPASRRPGPAVAGQGVAVGGHPLCLQSGEGAVMSPGAGPTGGAAGGGARKHLSFGLGEVGHSTDERPQRQPGDFFARMFGCFAPPRVSEVA
jgi:hypothetical protein